VANVLAALLPICPVSIPFGDNQRYDLVIEPTSGRFLRLQVKTGRIEGPSLYWNTTSSSMHRGGEKYGYLGQADYFAIWSPELNRAFLVPVSMGGRHHGCLRLTGPWGKALLANDHDLERVLTELAASGGTAPPSIG